MITNEKISKKKKDTFIKWVYSLLYSECESMRVHVDGRIKNKNHICIFIGKLYF